MRPSILVTMFLPLLLVAPAFADQSRVSVGRNIIVHEGETVGDLVCAFCSVRVHGEVEGDIAVLFGSLTVDRDRSVSGDVAVLGGDLSVGEDSVIGGDVTVAAGEAALATDATIRGSRSVFLGRSWLLLPLAPLLIVGGILWLILVVIQRIRYRHTG